jgi:Cu-Zn family superoxide dismutase
VRYYLAVPLLAALLSACATMTPAEPGATAILRTASGAEVGTVTATAMGDGVHVVVNAAGMPPGVHGAHIHTTGKCDAPDFASAGGHWNPTAAKHGTMHGPGHAGDLPNLTIAADGTGSLDAHSSSGTLAAMLDADGAAFVVHASADDMMTDPSGNSGARIACGVFSPR